MSKLKKIYGITGGVGVGKSTVIALLKKHFDACVIMADDVAKELMQPGKAGFEKTVDIFGKEVIKDGELNRTLIAEIIFSNPEKRTELNNAIHPLVKSYISEVIDTHVKKDDVEYIFVEAALLLEDNYRDFLDEIWFVTAPESVRRERLRKSRGYTDEKIDNIMKSQLGEETFKNACDKVIDNGNSIEETLHQLEILLD